MKRLLVFALTAAVALSAGAMAKKGALKVGTRVSIGFTPGSDNPYDPAAPSFGGKIKAARNCDANRKVTVANVAGGAVGRDTSDDSGHWSLLVASTLPSGTYEATAAAVKISAKEGKVLCKAGASATVSVP